MGSKDAVLVGQSAPHSQGTLRLDKDYFRCEKLNCTLLRTICGERSLRSKDILMRTDGVAKDAMVYMPCRGCETGQANAKLVKLVPKKLKTVRLGRAMSGTAA